MFQYAMLRGIAAKQDFDVAIPYHCRVSLWNFSLNALKLEQEYISPHVFRQKQFSYNPSVFEQPDGTNFVGYFQSEKYFTHIDVELRNTFIFPKSELIELSALELFRDGRPLVSVHIRRGDYRNNSAHADLYGNYYPNAMRLFPEALFVVFSDDMKWCRQYLKGDCIRYFQGSSMYCDMAGMATCDHHIISNSTYAWWGAWLNPSLTKRVVRPAVWWGPKTAHLDDHDICPESWEKVPI